MEVDFVDSDGTVVSVPVYDGQSVVMKPSWRKKNEWFVSHFE